MLLQLFYSSAQENGETVSGDLVINLKKSVRNPSLRIQAYEAAVTGQVSPLANFIIPMPHHRAVRRGADAGRFAAAFFCLKRRATAD